MATQKSIGKYKKRWKRARTIECPSCHKEIVLSRDEARMLRKLKEQADVWHICEGCNTFFRVRCRTYKLREKQHYFIFADGSSKGENEKIDKTPLFIEVSHF